VRGSPRAWAALWTVYVVWGSTYLGIELAGETIPPVLAAGIRFTLVGVLMGAWVVVRRGTAPFRSGGRRAIVSAVTAGLLLVGSNAMLFVAEQDVPIGVASLIIASVPLWLIAMRTVTGDRPSLAVLAGTLAGLAGVVVLARPGEHGSTSGLLLVVGSAFVWALGTFLSARLPMPSDAVTTTAVQTLAGGVVLLPIGYALRGDGSLDPSDWSTRSLVGLAYLVFIGSILGLTAYIWLVQHVPLSTVATYAYVNPVVAILLGVLVLHEQVTASIVLGAAIVLGSVAVVIRRDSGTRLTTVRGVTPGGDTPD
jgi:drug/metabolite transporter (DMT)-like permease